MALGLIELIRGGVYTIYALEKDSHCPVVEFLSKLEVTDMDALDSMHALLNRMADHGPGHNKQKFRSVGNGIYEFKAKQVRLCWFYDAGCMVICTHGFSKGTKRMQNRMIREAFDQKEAYFEAKKTLRIPIVRATET
jgi:phage-related protein